VKIIDMKNPDLGWLAIGKGYEQKNE